jgi:hypothetical protein
MFTSEERRRAVAATANQKNASDFFDLISTRTLFEQSFLPSVANIPLCFDFALQTTYQTSATKSADDR